MSLILASSEKRLTLLRNDLHQTTLTRKTIIYTVILFRRDFNLQMLIALALLSALPLAVALTTPLTLVVVVSGAVVVVGGRLLG